MAISTTWNAYLQEKITEMHYFCLFFINLFLSLIKMGFFVGIFGFIVVFLSIAIFSLFLKMWKPKRIKHATQLTERSTQHRSFKCWFLKPKENYSKFKIVYTRNFLSSQLIIVFCPLNCHQTILICYFHKRFFSSCVLTNSLSKKCSKYVWFLKLRP